MDFKQTGVRRERNSKVEFDLVTFQFLEMDKKNFSSSTSMLKNIMIRKYPLKYYS